MRRFGRIIRNRWIVATTSFIAGIVVLWFSWMAGPTSWWSGALVNAGTALMLFAPLLMIGRHIERRFDQVQAAQAHMEERQDATTSKIETLTEEISQTQAELRRTRDELSEAVARRLAVARQQDASIFADVGQIPSHDVIFTALLRAKSLHLITSDGCRVPIHNTNLYLWFETPTGRYQYDDEPDPSDDLYFRFEHSSGEEVARLSWPQVESAEDFLVTLAEGIMRTGNYPGDTSFEAGRIFADLRELLELAHASVVGGRTYPLNGVIEFCSPQWAITEIGLVSSGGTPSYSIGARRFDEMDWSSHMASKSWVDTDSFELALATASQLFKAGRMAVTPIPSLFEDEPPF